MVSKCGGCGRLQRESWTKGAMATAFAAGALVGGIAGMLLVYWLFKAI